MKTHLYSLVARAQKDCPLARLSARHARLWSALGFAALALVAAPVRGAVIEAWVQRYSNINSNSDDQAFKITRDAAGDVIVVGTTADGTGGPDMLTIKYSGVNGAVIWQKRYTGPPNDPDFDSFPSAVAVDASGNVIVTGGAGYSDNDGEDDYDYYTAKYAAADGALLWEKRYNGSGYFSDFPSAVAVDGSGNVIVTGYSKNSYSFFSADYYTAKYAAADGALLWEKRYSLGRDVPHAIAVDSAGNVVVTGESSSPGGYFDYYTVKYAAADGTVLWEKRYSSAGGVYDAANALALDASGNVAVTGVSGSDIYTAKYAAANGALLWEKRSSGSSVDVGKGVTVDAGGNVIVTGYSRNTASSDPIYDDYYTAKYAAADGALLWEKRYNGPGNASDQAAAVAVNANGDVVVTGYSFNTNNNNFNSSDYYTAKYAASDGSLVWEKRYNDAGNGWDEAKGLIIESNGDVVVSGFSRSTDPLTYDWYTAKYAAVDGALMWEQRYTGPGYGSDTANAVAIDRRGDVLVTGESDGSFYTAKYAVANGTIIWEQRHIAGRPVAMVLDREGNAIVAGSGDDYYTVKYAAANGALLWEQRYNGPANFTDNAYGVAVDSVGNVVVTGRSYGGASADDFYTAKYAAADGALLWERRYDGPANGNDGAQAVAVDSDGNVVVTGTDVNTNNNTDYYTAKYASADGALLWERRYNGPANNSDYAQAVAVDGSGNVAVTGSSRNGSGNDDYYTAKYASANGALLWEKRYNGPANRDDRAQALAVDARGNVVVTGFSYNGTNVDSYTAKYAAADGALLWEKRYSGGFAWAVGLDGSGNVVVTGYSSNGTNTDYYTAKYAANDGALLWEKRYNGPADGVDYVVQHGLAIGPNGSVAVAGASGGVPGPDIVFNYVTILYRENMPPVSAEITAGGVRIRFPGVLGRAYNIERAPSVTGPWSTIATPTTSTNGLIEYIDTNAPPGSAFYRTATTP